VLPVGVQVIALDTPIPLAPAAQLNVTTPAAPTLVLPPCGAAFATL
jgi:hypothetical protein